MQSRTGQPRLTSPRFTVVLVKSVFGQSENVALNAAGRGGVAAGTPGVVLGRGEESSPEHAAPSKANTLTATSWRLLASHTFEPICLPPEHSGNARKGGFYGRGERLLG